MEYEDGEKPNGLGDFDEQFTSPLNEGSFQLHELYLSHRAAGFSPRQAMYLLVVQLTENPIYPVGGVSDDDIER